MSNRLPIFNWNVIMMDTAKNSPLSLGKLTEKMNSDGIKATVMEFLAPRDIHKPVWTRWKTNIIAAIYL